MLKDIIPARFRRYVYAAYAVAVVVVGALVVGGLDVGTAPDVLAYLGGALGVVAAANTPASTSRAAVDYGAQIAQQTSTLSEQRDAIRGLRAEIAAMRSEQTGPAAAKPKKH